MTQMQLGVRELRENVRHNQANEALQSKELAFKKGKQKQDFLINTLNTIGTGFKIGSDAGFKLASMLGSLL